MIPEDTIIVRLQSLLRDHEKIPRDVLLCAKRLAELGVWHQFSRNTPATGCQDAARRRNRLGHEGIPLWDELKSFLGEYYTEDVKKVFLAHCRGDCELDLDKLRTALQFGGEVRRASPEAAEHLGMMRGTVNPFLTSVDALQVFDSELHRPVGVPGTVMTNAGDQTWAVEFDPSDLVVKLPGARWADIVQSQTEAHDRLLWGVREPITIGVLTGNPSDSGWDLCAAMNTHVRKLLGKNSLGDVSMPKIVIVSTPQIGISMEMDLRESPLREALLQGIDELCAAGSKLLVHPAHTTHYFASEMADHAKLKGARFLSMAEATADKLQAMGVKEIALLGTRYVTDLNQKWRVYQNAFQGFTVHRPSEAGWKKIHDLGYEVQQKGLTPLCFNWMRDLLKDEVPSSCEHVVLAMTELSVIARRLKTRGRQHKTLIDPVDIYAEAIAREYLGLPSSPGIADLESSIGKPSQPDPAGTRLASPGRE
jgi:aspartate racemase